MTEYKDNLNESSLRPDQLYKEWRELLKAEVEALAGQKEILSDVQCPGCHSEQSDFVFSKFNLGYKRCKDCGSLFVSPRPSSEKLNSFYQQSPAIKFWNDNIVKNTLGQRKQHEIAPLRKWMLEVVKASHPHAKNVVDYNPKFYSLFSFSDNDEFDKISFVNPLHVMPKDGVMVVPRLEDLEENADIITAFNVLDRESNPTEFLRKAATASNPGALLFLTVNTGSGFEYQVLREQSNRLVPPDRLNLLSVGALEKLLSEAGYEVLDISTPGQLDVEVIAKEFDRNPNLDIPDFIKYILRHRDDSLLKSLQSFLQLNNLSSFLRAVAIRK